MIIGIPKEGSAEETRVAVIPETIGKIKKLGLEVYVESGAGDSAYINDDEYSDAGATMVTGAEKLFRASDIIFKINSPSFHEMDFFKKNTTLICPLAIPLNSDLLNQLNSKNITVFALNLLPRIARAQSMDILSSMNNIAGYKSIIMAADHLGKIFPMMTTAAGTILPAKVMVIGAGVAGLQAIATARRLGAIVVALDTRPAVEEQIKSLGAEFISLSTHAAEAEDASGYAKEYSLEFYKAEQEIISDSINDIDVIVTSARVPGKRAPLLITEEMIKRMKKGAVIVDLAAAEKGNCACTKPGEIIVKDDITIIGMLNLPTTIPIHASQLYARNIYSFFDYVWPQIRDKHLDMNDEIIKNSLITYNGKIYSKC